MNHRSSEYRSQEPFPAGQVVLELLDAWRSNGIQWVPLTGVEELPEIDSDVDIALPERQVDQAIFHACKAAKPHGFDLVQALHYDLARCIALVFSNGEIHFQIDIESDDKGAGRLGNSRRQAIDLSSSNREFPTAEYIFRKRVYKGILRPDHRRSLREAANHLYYVHTDRLQQCSLRRSDLREVIQALNGSDASSTLSSIHRALWIRDFWNRPSLCFYRPLGALARGIERLRWLTGGAVLVVTDNRNGFADTAVQCWVATQGVFHRLLVLDHVDLEGITLKRSYNRIEACGNSGELRTPRHD